MFEKQIKEVVETYSKLSNDELMMEFAKHYAAQSQKDGGASMRKTIERIKPFLTPEQQKRMEEILRSVQG